MLPRVYYTVHQWVGRARMQMQTRAVQYHSNLLGTLEGSCRGTYLVRVWHAAEEWGRAPRLQGCPSASGEN